MSQATTALTRSRGAAALKSWRERADLTPNGAAKRLGVDRALYIRWEGGAGLPHLSTARKLEDLGITTMRSWTEAVE